MMEQGIHVLDETARLDIALRGRHSPPFFRLRGEGAVCYTIARCRGWETSNSRAGFSTAGNCYILKLEESLATHFRVRRLVFSNLGCSRPPADDKSAHPAA